MIITKTPLRIGLVGGGTDLPAYADKYGGAVVNLTINKYIYIAVNEKFDGMVRVSYAKTENVKSWEEVEHPLVKASLELYKIRDGIEIVSMADIPGQGSGLGSSSSFTVGLGVALWNYNGLAIEDGDSRFDVAISSAQIMAENACKVEIEMCGKPIGKQDQYAAAYGGLNYMTFGGEKVRVERILISNENMKLLCDHLMLFYIGSAPPSGDILKQQQVNFMFTDYMHEMKRLAKNVALELALGNFEFLGRWLHTNWAYKRATSHDISTAKINYLYDAARSAGAIGGKICGAGGGGFMLLFAPPEKHVAIIGALQHFRYLSVAPELNGSRVIHMTGLDD